jgi:hypothetical protein
MNAKRMASGISRYKALAKETHEYSVNLIHELPRDYRVVWKQAVCSEIDEKGGYAVYLLYRYKSTNTDAEGAALQAGARAQRGDVRVREGLQADARRVPRVAIGRRSIHVSLRACLFKSMCLYVPK